MITWYSLVHIEAVPLRDRSLKVEAIVLPSTLAHGAHLARLKIEALQLGTDLSSLSIRVTLDRDTGGSLSSSALAGTGFDSTRTDSIHLTSLSLFTDGYGHYGSSSIN